MINEDSELLESMMASIKVSSDMYRPGPYWQKQTVIAAKSIKKHGISNFRSSENNLATSYADNAYSDVRLDLLYGVRRIILFFLNLYPFNVIFNSQVQLTKSYYLLMVKFKNELVIQSKHLEKLLQKYRIPSDTTRGGCLDKSVMPDGMNISNHYLSLLDTHHILANNIDFTKARSFFEIGGGFGVNIHIIIENYSNIKKIIYLDIPPNLYVGTQYLKSFYGDKVKSYLETKASKNIKFSDNDDLEIFCIIPSQIEHLNVEIDIFQNSHSFVEMPKTIVGNYAKHIERLTKSCNGKIALVSYDCFDLSTTFHPDELPNFFGGNFLKLEEPTLWNHNSKNLYYISN